MRNPISRTLAGIVIFMAVVSLACNLSSAAPTSAPLPTSATSATSATSTTSATSATGATAVPAATLAATAVPSGGGGIAGGGCANAYYPAASGDSWAYSSDSTTPSGTSVLSYTYTTAVTAASQQGFTTSSQASTGVDTTVNWTCQNGNLAALDVQGVTTATSKVTLTINSVSGVGYNIPAAFDAGQTWTETLTATATIQASPTKTVDAQIVSHLDCNGAGADKITLPVGNFDTVKAACSKTVIVSTVVQGKITPGSTIQENITYWYAKKVGLVKSVAMINPAGNNNGATATPVAIQTVTLTHYQVQ
jgi:hypothetical protein